MACIEIKVKDQVFKILNDGTQSEVFNTSDWALIKNFLQYGELPQGFWVEGAEDVNRFNLFDHILNSLAKEPDNSSLYVGMLSNSVSRTDFINKFVGQEELNKTLDWNYRYNPDILDRNVFISSSWGYDKNWYGFTDKRALLLTGNTKFSEDRKVKILYEAYLDLKNGDSKTTSIIENLANKFNISGDIYNKLTELANNHIEETIASLFTPYNSKEELDKNALKESIEDYKGKIIRFKDNFYIIKAKTEKTIIALNVNTNKNEQIPIGNVRAVYNPYTLSFMNKNYMLVGNDWFLLEGDKFLKISDTMKEQLFLHWFGIAPNEASINLYTSSKKKSKYKSVQNPIYINTSIDGISLEELLPVGTKIRTDSGIYIKTEEGDFVNGDYSLGNKEKINEIVYPYSKDLESKLLTLKTVKNDEETLNKEELEIILNDLFNVSNFDNIWFNYKQDELVRVSSVLKNDVYVPVVQIGMKNAILANSDTFSRIKLALNYYNYLTDNSISKIDRVDNPKEFWPILVNKVFGDNTVEVSDQILQVIDNLKKDINDNSDGNILIEAVNNNKERLYKQYQNSDEKVDAFIKELINKGLYIVSCELK